MLLPVSGHAFNPGCDLWFGGGGPAGLPAYSVANRRGRVVTTRNPSSLGRFGKYGDPTRTFSDSKMRTHPPLFAQSSLLADGLWLPGFNCEKYFWWGPTRETRLFGVRWREGDSPEIIRLIVLIDKLDCIAGNALEGSQLRDDTGRNLNAAIISHEDDRTNQQLAI